MFIFTTFISVGILWFLITFFSGSTNSEQSLRETWIVILGVGMVGLIGRFLLGPFAFLLEIVALYFLILKVCDLRRQIAMKICGYYLAISFLISLVLALFWA
ncbi:MAG: hypothetical protein Q7Q71_09215 [Verrucomicrobiota bacterium JB023]|nr:hypothetical protein [Verrucomicrobiota bacterium JB023]